MVWRYYGLAIIEAVNSLIGEAVEKWSQREDVYALTFVGNSCMPTWLQLEPRYIALAPYVPVTDLQEITQMN